MPNFNPRAPCGARRQWRYTGVYRCHFNPRAPRGARHADGSFVPDANGISIHAPREGRDLWKLSFFPERQHFNPRAPCGARRACRRLSTTSRWNFNPRAPRGARPHASRGRCGHHAISIHAPREGRDLPSWAIWAWNFLFQSTRPARGATCRRQLCPGRQRHFNPRAPRGARPHRPGLPAVHDVFQSTRPMRGATSRWQQ